MKLKIISKRSTKDLESYYEDFVKDNEVIRHSFSQFNQLFTLVMEYKERKKRNGSDTGSSKKKSDTSKSGTKRKSTKDES